MAPKLTDPVRILSLGAGVQSSTVLRMAICGEIAPIKHAIFADTGWEPKAVYQHLKSLKEEANAANIDLRIVRKGNIRDDSLAKNAFVTLPLHTKSVDGKKGILKRQCTETYKIRPLHNEMRKIVGIPKKGTSQAHLVTSVIGISWDESQRMRDPHFPWIKNDYPLVDLRMTREDCFLWNEQNGFPPPPRSACLGCPFKSKQEWSILQKNPAEWADVVDFDNKIRHGVKEIQDSEFFLHGSKIPLKNLPAVEAEALSPNLNLFDLECEGMCGL